jgi:hypothetical protein
MMNALSVLAQTFDGDIIIGNPHKVNVDDNYKVVNLSGEGLRLQWSIVVMNYCRNDIYKASQIYKELFVNYDEFMYPTKYQINTIYRQAFDREFGIFVTDKRVEIHSPHDNTNGIVVKDNQWLLDYGDKIVQTIDQYKCVQVVAPTGTGKTFFMNHLASKRKCILVVPFNSQIYLYKKIPDKPNKPNYPFVFGKPDPDPTPEEIEAERIAKTDYNYVCVKQKKVIDNRECIKYSDAVKEPFVGLKRTVDQEDKPMTVEVEYEIPGEKIRFDPEKSNVCVWDQFANRIYGLDTQFHDHIIVVDESHLLFCDRSYRESAVRFITLLKKFKGKIVLVTATPTWEHQLLSIDKTLTFQRKRELVKLKWIDTINTYSTIERLIDVLRGTNSIIVVFSDVNARMLYENCLAKEKYKGDEITMLHSKFLDNSKNNAIDVLNKELLDRKLTICTKIAYAGINFKNENEKIIVIIEVNQNTDYAYVIQALGRIRNAEVEAYVVFDRREYSEESVANRMMATQELKTHQDDPIVSAFLLDEEKNTNWDVEKQLEIYYSKEADKEVIIEKICKCGYVEVWDYGRDQFAPGRKEINEYKRKESDLFIETVINTDYHEPLDFSRPSTGYKQEWLIRYHRILNDMRQEDVKEYTKLRKEKSTIQIDAIMEELEDLIGLAKMPSNIQVELRDNYMKYAEKATKNWESSLAKSLITRKCKTLSSILNRVFITNGITRLDEYSLDILLNAKTDMIEEAKMKISVIRSKNGKKGDKKKKSEGGKKGNKDGKIAGGRKGGKKSSRKQAITLEWIGDDDQRPDGLDEMGRIRFESKTLCRDYLGVGSECFSKFCKTHAEGVKLCRKWKIVKIE